MISRRCRRLEETTWMIIDPHTLSLFSMPMRLWPHIYRVRNTRIGESLACLWPRLRDGYGRGR